MASVGLRSNGCRNLENWLVFGLRLYFICVRRISISESYHLNLVYSLQPWGFRQPTHNLTTILAKFPLKTPMVAMVAMVFLSEYSSSIFWDLYWKLDYSYKCGSNFYSYPESFSLSLKKISSYKSIYLTYHQ